MIGHFKRSWGITKLTFSVINKDKELYLFPILSGVFSMLLFFIMIFPALLAGAAGALGVTAVQGLFLFVVYFGIAFIATFFNVCTVYTAKVRFEKGNATFMESIRFAFSKLHLIALWSLVAGTVGLLLRMLDNMAKRSEGIGSMALGFLQKTLGMAWAIVTIFVVPGLVYHNLGPFAAIKKSYQVLKKTWGESLIRYFGFGAIEILLYVLGAVLFLPFIIVFLFSANWIMLIILVTLAVFYGVFIGVTFSLAASVYNTALYVYAETGKIPSGFTQESMKGAFKGQGFSKR